MKQREFLTLVVDTVEAQQEAIDELRKEAAEAKAKPAFSEDVLSQTAEKLVAAELISKEAADTLVQSFPETHGEGESAVRAGAVLAESRREEPSRRTVPVLGR